MSFAGGVLACAQSLALIVSSPLIGLATQASGNYVGISLALGAWIVPGTVVYVGYASSLERQFYQAYRPTERGFFFKASYLARL